MTKVAIVYYSMYGHIRKMAEEIKKGLVESRCEVTFLQCPETLPEEVLGKMGAPAKPDDEVATADRLKDFDAFMFGIPTRFGMAPAQMKSFWDSTGGLWQAGALVGKPAGIFFATGTQNGGQETTALTFVTQLVHHGIIYVPMGYSTTDLFDMSAPHGGSPYGSGTLAGADGSRQPSDLEKKIAVHHGKYFGGVAAKLAK
uniref:Flavodoxin-like domain-containing protein n=1 Tax=Hemiselmis andersenii TaxID=464988 RepID=A0A6U4ZY15_HEMAN|mmetsp:Transcript_44380/g.108281  ORF Transcript_44380/g.108281 Transcript_44380/m.108281 type:complete len:200 (+) Transcript_44380:179-778(+)|eukprot:CAMPEP_0114139166 /NCGR_PEP_ID=MMETSP0043_2-20121206/16710_1 /TAXON_ID=464988 /ORGANISM="Hemiselmis andersenii, Strain CCMP644" /LENGTH=199 /DNA_ID=CAMNT_0001233183 /DNA_START=162 /DNA_END=761 /DNA_ORIENTATION=-